MNNANYAKRSRVCAIAGGSGAGKTTLALKLLDRLNPDATHFTIDWYYRDLRHLAPAERDAVNFDDPASLEVELFVSHLEQLIAGEKVAAPVYDFATHTRTGETLDVTPRSTIVTEGIHLLGLELVRPLCDINVFIDVPAEVRLNRRIERDTVERGRSAQSVRAQWARTVAPMHESLVEPSKAFADRIVSADEDLDTVADELADTLTARPS